MTDDATDRLTGPSPAAQVARDMFRRGLPVVPFAMLVGALFGGTEGLEGLEGFEGLEGLDLEELFGNLELDENGELDLEALLEALLGS